MSDWRPRLIASDMDGTLLRDDETVSPATVAELDRWRAEGVPVVLAGQYRLGDVRHVVASPDRARDELGFTAQVSFEDGMREFATAPLRGDAPGA